MEKLDKVIDALERCLDGDEACPGCYLHDYDGCRDKLNLDALDLLKELSADNQRLREMWAEATKNLSIVVAERDEARREAMKLEAEPKIERILDADWIKVDYCKADRPVILVSEFIKGVWFDHYCDLPTGVEPVVHAHWEWRDLHGDGSLTLCCSNCLNTDVLRVTTKFCSECGAHMDEEVADV